MNSMQPPGGMGEDTPLEHMDPTIFPERERAARDVAAVQAAAGVRELRENGHTELLRFDPQVVNEVMRGREAFPEWNLLQITDTARLEIQLPADVKSGNNNTGVVEGLLIDESVGSPEIDWSSAMPVEITFMMRSRTRRVLAAAFGRYYPVKATGRRYNPAEDRYRHPPSEPSNKRIAE